MKHVTFCGCAGTVKFFDVHQTYKEAAETPVLCYVSADISEFT